MFPLIIISAPSGTGKTTVVNKLLQMQSLPVERVITCTTRKPRKGEVHGKDYYFLSNEEFLQNKKEGKFLESTTTYDHHYGTLRESVQEILDQKKVPLLVIDIEGHKQVMKKWRPVKSIFLMPPSFKELKSRLETRSTDGEEEVKKRLKRAKLELSQKGLYDTIIVNNEVEGAALEIQDHINQWIKE